LTDGRASGIGGRLLRSLSRRRAKKGRIIMANPSPAEISRLTLREYFDRFYAIPLDGDTEGGGA